MDTNDLMNEIADKDVDVDKFAKLAIEDEQLRYVIVKQLLHNPKIKVYYHWYYVVSKASEERPDLFYAYWEEIASLIHHDNSYHRHFVPSILANLAQVDQGNYVSDIYDPYFALVNDEKVMTSEYCIKHNIKIIKNKPQYKDQILNLLLYLDNHCDYSEKQKELLMS
jgi:hypothetical protein